MIRWCEQALRSRARAHAIFSQPSRRFVRFRYRKKPYPPSWQTSLKEWLKGLICLISSVYVHMCVCVCDYVQSFCLRSRRHRCASVHSRQTSMREPGQTMKQPALSTNTHSTLFPENFVDALLNSTALPLTLAYCRDDGGRHESMDCATGMYAGWERVTELSEGGLAFIRHVAA